MTAGYTIEGLTIGDAYTALAVVWREADSPVVAVTADGYNLGTRVTMTGSWIESRLTFLAIEETQVVGLTRVDTGQLGLVHLGGLLVTPVRTVDEPYLGPYFDGSTAGSAMLVENSWVNGIFSPSSSVSLAPESHTFTSAVTNSPAGQLTASAAIRSELGAEVTMMIRSGIDHEVLGMAIINPTSEWVRYDVITSFGRSAYVEFLALGQYDVDHVMLGDTLAYFDGDSSPDVMVNYTTGKWANEYSVGWTGQPHNSASEVAWNGSTEIQRCESDWRPFMSVDEGKLQRANLYLESTPAVSADAQVEPYERHFEDVDCVEGPSVISEFAMSGGSMREVDFLLVAGSPFAYGPTRTLLDAISGEVPEGSIAFEDPIITTPEVFVIVDPDCAVIPPPPRPPAIPNLCIENPTSWRRSFVTIDGGEISGWSQNVPTITLLSGSEEVRQVRVRFHPNPFNYAPDQVDPLNYCSEFILTYLPANTELTVDGLVRRAIARVNGRQPLPAGNLLYGTDGIPMTWPELSCGISYVMTVDTPAAEVPSVSIGLALTRRE